MLGCELLPSSSLEDIFACHSVSGSYMYRVKPPQSSISIKHVSISVGFCSTLSEKNNEILFSLHVGQIVNNISQRVMKSFVTRETLYCFLKLCLKSTLHSKCAICVFHYQHLPYQKVFS